VIGSNKRYAAQIDARMNVRADEMTMRGTLETLSEAELELDLHPLTKTSVAVSARAWVRYPASR
jgi:hypothetical protein